jgi:hypothetical protein
MDAKGARLGISPKGNRPKLALPLHRLPRPLRLDPLGGVFTRRTSPRVGLRRLQRANLGCGNGTTQHTLEIQSGWVYFLAFSSKGIIAAGSDDCSITHYVGFCHGPPVQTTRRSPRDSDLNLLLGRLWQARGGELVDSSNLTRTRTRMPTRDS